MAKPESAIKAATELPSSIVPKIQRTLSLTLDDIVYLVNSHLESRGQNLIVEKIEAITEHDRMDEVDRFQHIQIHLKSTTT